MSNQGPEQTAIVAFVPTEDAPRVVELMNSANIPEATIDTYPLPTSRQEAEHLAGRLAAMPATNYTASYEVTPHESKPMSLIKEIATGEVTEAITKANFKAVSRNLYDTPHAGSGLTNRLVSPRFLWESGPGFLQAYLERYIYRYKHPVYKDNMALLVSRAPELLARYDQGELNLKLSKRGRGILAHICELIEVDNT